jgi:hypothetical protein
MLVNWISGGFGQFVVRYWFELTLTFNLLRKLSAENIIIVKIEPLQPKRMNLS